MSNTVEINYNENDLIEWGKEQLNKITYGSMTYELTPVSYDDYISADTMLKAFNNYSEKLSTGQTSYEHFKDYLKDYVLEKWGFESIDNAEMDMYNQIFNNADLETQVALNDFVTKYGLSDYEILEKFDYKGSSFDLDGFLRNNEYYVNIMFATQTERNYDMSSITTSVPNSDNISYILDNPSAFEDVSNNALTYLIHQQGHSLAELYDTYYSEESSDNKFIDSVANEIRENYYGGMTELTALISGKGTELVDVLDNIAHKKDYIKLSENTTIGLFNEWNGAGSALEISLEIPAVIPADMVRNVQFESRGNDYVQENNGYTVDNVYGLVGSVWDGKIEVTDKSPAMIEENTAYLHSAFTEAVEKNSNENKKTKTNIELN